MEPILKQFRLNQVCNAYQWFADMGVTEDVKYVNKMDGTAPYFECDGIPVWDGDWVILSRIGVDFLTKVISDRVFKQMYVEVCDGTSN